MSGDSGDHGHTGNRSGHDSGHHRDRPVPTDEQKIALDVWKEALSALDPRYKSKSLLKVIAKAMLEADFRTQIIASPDSVYSRFGTGSDWPADVSLVFYENTAQQVVVVLPPTEAELESQAPALRDLLRSRTSHSSIFGFGLDDNDLGDWSDIAGNGVPDSGDTADRDPPIVQPPPPDHSA